MISDVALVLNIKIRVLCIGVLKLFGKYAFSGDWLFASDLWQAAVWAG